MALRDQKETILAELNEKFSQKRSDEYAIITLGIERGGNIRYLGDLQAFKNILLRKGKDKYYLKKSQGESLGKDSACSVCRGTKDEVYGFAIPWTFHTFDKPGFIAGGFKTVCLKLNFCPIRGLCLNNPTTFFSGVYLLRRIADLPLLRKKGA